MATQESTLRVGVDSEPMVRGAKKGEDSLDKLGKKATKTQETFTRLQDKTQLLARAFTALIGIGVAAFFTRAVQAAGTFETKMAEISTLVDTAVFQMEKLEAAIKDASAEFASPAVQQGAAAYQIISAGAGTAADAIDLLTASNKLAVGGVTDVATAADGLTSLLNAYGLASSEATNVSDALFVGMRAGKTTIGELSSSLGKVAPLAAQAGVGVDELVASVAALTKGGISTRESVTGVRAIMAAVVKPTSEAAEVAEKLGIQFNSAGLQSKGLAGFMEDLVAKTGGNTDAMAKLFGGVEALIPALALAGQAGVDMGNILEDMANKGGATQEAFEKMSNTFEFQAGRLRQNLNNVLIELGSILTAILTPAIKFLNENFEALTRFVTVAAAGFATLMIPAIVAMIPAIASATAGFVAMAAAFALTPFGMIATAILAAAAALAYFGDTNVMVGSHVVSVWEVFTAAVQVAWDLIMEGIAIVSDVFGTIVDVVGGAISSMVSKISEWTGGWKESVGTVGELLKTFVNTSIGIHVGFIKALWSIITTGIPAMFKLAIGLAQNAVIAGLQFIINAAVSALGGLGDALSYIPGVADDLGDSIRGALTVNMDGLRADTDALTSSLVDAGAAARDAFSESVQTDYIGAAGEALGRVGDNLQDRVISKFAEAEVGLDAFGGAGTTVAEVTNEVVAPALDNLGKSAGGAAKAMNDLNKEREKFMEGIDEEFAKIQESNGGAVAAVEEWYNSQKMKLQELGLAYTEYADKLDVIFKERMADAYQTDLDNATDWRSGIERAVMGLGESIGNEADLAEMALTSLFDNAANAIVEFAKTGQLDFKKFAQSVAADILMMTTKMLMLKALKAVLGVGFADGGEVGGFADGGLVKKFASGGAVSGPGGPRTDSIPAMLSNGEFVVNANATKDFLPLLEMINAGNMDMMGLAMGGLANESASLPAQPAPTAAEGGDNKENGNKGQGGANLTIIPTINPSDIVDTFDSDDGDRVLINMLERNKTTIRGVLG